MWDFVGGSSVGIHGVNLWSSTGEMIAMAELFLLTSIQIEEDLLCLYGFQIPLIFEEYIILADTQILWQRRTCDRVCLLKALRWIPLHRTPFLSLLVHLASIRLCLKTNLYI